VRRRWLYPQARHSWFGAVLPLLLACSDGDSSAGNINDDAILDIPPFWQPVSTTASTDLGAEVRPIPPEAREAGGPVALVDRTEAAGLADVAGGGNQHGVGVLFTDLDGDDFADLLVVNGRSNITDAWTPSRYLRNRGDGTFAEATSSSGLGALLDGVDLYSVAAGDIDRDGDIDLYLGAQPTDMLLANQGDGTFVDATSAMNAGGPPSDPELVADGRSKVVSLGDLDGDGWLDIASASGTFTQPPRGYLLRNRGGDFTDVTAERNLTTDPFGNACAVLWSDHDNDGRQDLWIWNDRGGHVLLQNEAAGLRNVADERDDVVIFNPMGIDSADINHDGFLDYYVSNVGNNPLLVKQPDGTFADRTRTAGTGGEFGWGLGFEDFNHDTWPDIFVAQEDDRPYLLFTHGGDPDDLRFSQTELAHAPIVDNRAAHNVAVAFADYDRDGRTDVLTATTDGSRVNLYRNMTDTGTRGWLHVSVAAAPGGGRGGVGARVAVKTGDLIQFDDIKGGDSRASQSELSTRFGLGHWTGAEWVAVLWPDGRARVLRNVPANMHVRVGAD